MAPGRKHGSAAQTGAPGPTSGLVSPAPKKEFGRRVVLKLGKALDLGSPR